MNSFGQLFRISIYGESHGNGVGVLIEGVPPGTPVSVPDFEEDLSRRRSGSPGTTARKEPDIPELISGIFNGKATGAPVNIFFRNSDVESGTYELHKNIPRPGHADLVSLQKYKGFNDYRGGGMFSGRMTAGIVAAGVIAKKILDKYKISARLVEAGGTGDIDHAVSKTAATGNSIGGIVECRVDGLPAGIGEPFFDSAESVLSHLLFSIPGIKGVEFGAGFASSKMKGDEFNDPIMDASGTTGTNHSGGINGGITNGNQVVFRVAVRPSSSILLEQESIDLSSGNLKKFSVEGRHDSCFALRVPVVVEAVTAIALTDLIMTGRYSSS